MAVDLKVPPAGESITNVVVSEWLVEPGGWVKVDDIVVVLETDKINVEVPAPVSGTVGEVFKKPGDTAQIGDVLGTMVEGEAPAGDGRSKKKPGAKEKAAPKQEPAQEAAVAPAARRLLAQEGLQARDVDGTGPGGRVLKEDVLRHLEEERPSAPAPVARAQKTASAREEDVQAMTPLRRKIAERLVQAQQTAALLTTFNEVDMTEVMALRKAHQDAFTKKHGIKLGFMSFFVKASIEALKAFPAVNAEIRDDSIVYKNYYDIGVAVGGGKGLVVPVIRDAHRLSFAEIELAIKDYAERAQAMKLKLDELQGGTFTISNGGVYGSMLSTPIINPPQSGILGLHKIQERPVAVAGKVEVRPVMYLALSYDHRIVDGREAVSFLVRIKDCIENPARMLLEV